MNIYKLNYLDKETAIKDFIKKVVYIETKEGLIYGQGIQAVVEIGKIVLENGTYDSDFKELTAPVYADGYAFDIMSDIEIVFASEIFPLTPRHNFAGCEPINNNLIE
jgi:hypothetical protein